MQLLLANEADPTGSKGKSNAQPQADQIKKKTAKQENQKARKARSNEKKKN